MGGGVPGLRVSYGTYNTVKLQTQQAAFLIKEYLCNNLPLSAYSGTSKLTAPWVMYWSSDGTTGPSGPGDNTDRITDHTKFATRADSDSSPISYYVLRSGSLLRPAWLSGTMYDLGDVVTNAGSLYCCVVAGTSVGGPGPTSVDRSILITDGTVQWRCIGPGDGYLYLCVAYRTSQDYFLSFSYSTKFSLAATTTYYPVAASGTAICLAGNHDRWLMGSDGSGDRILQITASDDGVGFWIAAPRAADIPTNGGAVVLGRINNETYDGTQAAVLALPTFLWNAQNTSLKSDGGASSTTTPWSYDLAYTTCGVLYGIAPLSMRAMNNCLLMIPFGRNPTSPLTATWTTDSFVRRRKVEDGYGYQAYPFTHVAGSDFSNGIWGTVQDMNLASVADASAGLLFGLRWWCYGMLLIPNPSELEPTNT